MTVPTMPNVVDVGDPVSRAASSNDKTGTENIKIISIFG